MGMIVGVERGSIVDAYLSNFDMFYRCWDRAECHYKERLAASRPLDRFKAEVNRTIALEQKPINSRRRLPNVYISFNISKLNDHASFQMINHRSKRICLEATFWNLQVKLFFCSLNLRGCTFRMYVRLLCNH
jgi:hypothetical protein